MKTLIPAIDLHDGKVVRLKQGRLKNKIIYSNDPIEIVKKFFYCGASWLHIINLDGAFKGNFHVSRNYEAIKKILSVCQQLHINVQIGGGIRSIEIVQELLDQGVNRIIIGTLAFQNQNLFKLLIDSYPSNIILGLDFLKEKVKIKGWLEDTDSNIINTFRNFESSGVQNFIITDIERDGMSSGLNLSIYKRLREIKKPTTKIIASGGVSSIQNALNALEICESVIIGKSLYDGTISLDEITIALDKIHKSHLVKRIIPCLDVKEGRVVKGIQFQNLIDSGDPVELAKYYNDQGADELVFLDISATIEGRKSMLNVIRLVAEEIFIPLTVGGGIDTIEDVTEIIKAGAEKVSINSGAIKNPNLIQQCAKKFGSQSIVVAIDAKHDKDSWTVYTHGGTRFTGINVIEWAVKAVKLGAGELLVTSMDRDGTQEGYDLELIKAVTNHVNVPVIASGGAGTLKHFKDAVKVGSEAILAASLFHTNKLKIKDVKEYLNQNNIKIRKIS